MRKSANKFLKFYTSTIHNSEIFFQTIMETQGKTYLLGSAFHARTLNASRGHGQCARGIIQQDQLWQMGQCVKIKDSRLALLFEKFPEQKWKLFHFILCSRSCVAQLLYNIRFRRKLSKFVMKCYLRRKLIILIERKSRKARPPSSGKF